MTGFLTEIATGAAIGAIVGTAIHFAWRAIRRRRSDRAFRAMLRDAGLDEVVGDSPCLPPDHEPRR